MLLVCQEKCTRLVVVRFQLKFLRANRIEGVLEYAPKIVSVLAVFCAANLSSRDRHVEAEAAPVRTLPA